MSILYVGPYRQTDEWGLTSRAFANLLVAQKELDVVLRPIWFNNQNHLTDIGGLEEYESKDIEEPDTVIQHGLPGYLNYNGKFKTNIAVTSIDCRFDNSDWVTHLNLFDQVIVFSEYEATLLKDSGVTCKITSFKFAPVILHTEQQDIGLKFDGTKYYTIGSLDVKSGLREILAGYLSTFTILDNTILIVMTNDNVNIENEIKNIKGGLGIFTNEQHYPHVALINSVEPQVLAYVHNYGDYYIDISYNSRTGQNLLRAIAQNSLPIMLDTCRDIIPEYPFIVDSDEDISLYPQRPLAYMYTGEFSWKMPNMKSLRTQLKNTYNAPQDDLDREQQKVAKFRSQMFTLPNQWIREALCIQ